MELNFFNNLPSEIIVDIISRLPIRIVVSCKLVQKSWRDLLQTRKFADSHLCKSTSRLATSTGSRLTKIFKCLHEIDFNNHQYYCTPITKFHWDEFDASCTLLQGSANGFLLLLGSDRRIPYICNPITWEYIQLPNQTSVYSISQSITFGFGVTKVTGQYKVVRIVHDCIIDLDTYKVLKIASCACDVYTLGTTTWRSIAHVPLFADDRYSIPLFLGGSLHWSVADFEGANLISCFDLEMEIFSTFSPPSCLIGNDICFAATLVALGEYLCMCENSDCEIVIWLMKEYDNERSWIKEFVIKKSFEFIDGYRTLPDIVYPMKIFEGGDLLMMRYNLYMFYYSNGTKTIQPID